MSHYTNQRIITEQEWWNSLRSQIGQTTYSESYCVDLNEMDFLDPSKSPILQGAKNFAGGLSTGLKQGYDKGYKDVEDLGKFLTPGILKTIEVVANVSQKFADKFGISPVTAAMIVGIAATAPAALPAYILALSLRRVATNLANKMYDTAWEKLTGKTVEELDKMWVDWKSKNPTAATPKVVADSFDSFNSFLRNKDINLYQKIYLENEYQEDARGVGEFLGKGLGYGAGAGVSIISNSISSIAKVFSSVMKMIANNPVATGKVLFGVIIGYYVGKLGAKATEKVTDMIQGKLSAAESDDIRKVAEKVGVPKEEIQKVANDTGNKDFVNYLENPPDGSVNVADARSLADKGRTDAPTYGFWGSKEIPSEIRELMSLPTTELSKLSAEKIGDPVNFWKAINRAEAGGSLPFNVGRLEPSELFNDKEKQSILMNMIGKFDTVDKVEMLKHIKTQDSNNYDIFKKTIENWEKYHNTTKSAIQSLR